MCCPPWAANLCLSNAARDQFFLRGIGAKIEKKKSKPVSGYVCRGVEFAEKAAEITRRREPRILNTLAAA